MKSKQYGGMEQSVQYKWLSRIGESMNHEPDINLHLVYSDDSKDKFVCKN